MNKFKHKIYIQNSQKVITPPKGLCRLIRYAVAMTLEFEGFKAPAEVSVTFVSDAKIKKLNEEYRNKDSATDVLSFPMLDGGDEPTAEGDDYVMLGDIVLSLERAMDQAKNFPHPETPSGGDPFMDETAFLCIHSTLHLLGYDHETGPEDEAEMFARQNEIMNELRNAVL